MPQGGLPSDMQAQSQSQVKANSRRSPLRRASPTSPGAKAPLGLVQLETSRHLDMRLRTAEGTGVENMWDMRMAGTFGA